MTPRTLFGIACLAGLIVALIARNVFGASHPDALFCGFIALLSVNGFVSLGFVIAEELIEKSGR